MLSRDKEHGEETEEALTTLRRGYAKIRNYPPGSTEFWLLLYSKRFLRLPTCGLKWSMPRGRGKETGLMHQGMLGLRDCPGGSL